MLIITNSNRCSHRLHWYYDASLKQFKFKHFNTEFNGIKMHGECKLCKRYCKLQESHFIPKFVGKWLKKTSITGYIRESNVIHKRRQDIEKEYWLCGDCEKLFSSWETKFSTHIFFPVLEDNQSTLQYSEWMAKFCASLSWRTVTYIRSKNSERNEDSFYVNSLNGAEEHLAGFLLGREKIWGNMSSIYFHWKK